MLIGYRAFRLDLPVTCEPFFRTGTDKNVHVLYNVLHIIHRFIFLWIGYLYFLSTIPSNFYVKMFHGGFFT